MDRQKACYRLGLFVALISPALLVWIGTHGHNDGDSPGWWYCWATITGVGAFTVLVLGDKWLRRISWLGAIFFVGITSAAGLLAASHHTKWLEHIQAQRIPWLFFLTITPGSISVFAIVGMVTAGLTSYLLAPEHAHNHGPDAR